jgi:outer membrane receptor protein involved in Fe transport
MKLGLRVAFLFILFPFTTPAAEPPHEATLDPVVVSDTRLRDIEQPISRIPGKVIAITADEIQKLGARTIQEVLQYQTGVVLYDQIGNEFQQTVDLRGFNGQPVPATSVFVDGVRVNEPDFNQTNFDLIPIEDIDRIEIIPGTATVFGRNALGGVINITTKRGRSDKSRFGFDLGGGSFARQKYSFSADGPLPLNNFEYYFGVARELTDGFRDATGGRITRLLGKLGYRWNQDSDATLTYTHVLDHLKQAGSLPASVLRLDRDANLSPGDFYDANLNQLALNIHQKLPAGVSLAVNGYFRSNDLNTFVNFDKNDGSCPLCNSNLDTKIRSGGGTIQLTHDASLWNHRNLLTGGIEYNRNSFGIKNKGDFFGPFLTKQSTDENVVGIYLSNSLNVLQSVILHAGFRYDWDRFDFTDQTAPSQSGVKTFHRISPKLGIIYSPSEGLNFSFSYSQGARMPTVTEIFAQGPFGSNPGLAPMTSQNFEFGAKLQPTSWLEGSLAAFYMPVKDEILFTVTDPVTFTGQNNNISHTLRRGVEVSLKSRWGKLLDGFINYTVTKSTFETDVLLFSGQVKKGDELPLVPRHRVAVGAHWYPLDGLTVSLMSNYVARQFLLNDEPNNAKRLADYFVLNGRAAYQWRNWTAQMILNNITNRKYSTFGILGTEPNRVPAPGINVFAGITFRY